mmetsp:Transcript_2217/g.6458  ORF Transcript_2217/g.6458 Transcript_2217/m.6458 type:complete len:208 (+) Transcript_2217:568-1191(+)
MDLAAIEAFNAGFGKTEVINLLIICIVAIDQLATVNLFDPPDEMILGQHIPGIQRQHCSPLRIDRKNRRLLSIFLPALNSQGGVVLDHVARPESFRLALLDGRVERIIIIIISVVIILGRGVIVIRRLVVRQRSINIVAAHAAGRTRPLHILLLRRRQAPSLGLLGPGVIQRHGQEQQMHSDLDGPTFGIGYFGPELLVQLFLVDGA